VKKTILLTNDDGYDSLGLVALREALEPFGRVIVVAPATEKSACAHSITLKSPLQMVEISEDFYKVEDGTPSDCIYLSKDIIFRNFSPDLVVSGINRGANMGEDITYSGTVAGAMEGVLQGFPSIAISQVIGKGSWDNIDYTLAKEVIAKIVGDILANGYPLGAREIMNINIPPKGDGRIETTYAGHRLYGNDLHHYYSPRGEKLYWLGMHPLQWSERDLDEKYNNYRSDFDAVFSGAVSITPIKIDLTAYERVEELGSWLNRL
jgi:5'-nucleotidase